MPVCTLSQNFIGTFDLYVGIHSRRGDYHLLLKNHCNGSLVGRNFYTRSMTAYRSVSLESTNNSSINLRIIK